MDVAAIWSKAQLYLYKVYTLLKIDKKDITDITDNTVENSLLTYEAKKMMDEFIPDALRLYSTISPSVISVISQDVLTAIEKHGKIDNNISDSTSVISHSKLYLKIFDKHGIHARKFIQIMGNLKTMGKVKAIEVKGKTKPMIYYALVKYD